LNPADSKYLVALRAPAPASSARSLGLGEAGRPDQQGPRRIEAPRSDIRRKPLGATLFGLGRLHRLDEQMVDERGNGRFGFSVLPLRRRPRWEFVRLSAGASRIRTLGPTSTCQPPGAQLATSTVAHGFFVALPFGELGPAITYQVLGVLCRHNHSAVFAYVQIPARICLHRPDAVPRAKANPGTRLTELLGLPTIIFEDAPTLHRGIEHFKGTAAGVDLIVMSEFGEAFHDTKQVLVPRAAQDLHIASPALRAKGPEPCQLITALGRRSYGEAAQ